VNIRCVVTGRDPSGKSVFTRDSAVEPITLASAPGLEFHRLWGSDAIPTLPSDGTPPAHPRYFPPAGGFRFGFFTIPPESKILRDPTTLLAAFSELETRLPGMAEVLEPMHPGMHTTDTVDFDVVLSGEVFMELDAGAEVHLKPGDCVIQNGTRHEWHNRSSSPCVIAVVLVGASRR